MDKARYFLAISGDFKGEVFMMMNPTSTMCMDDSKKLVCLNDGYFLADDTTFGKFQDNFVEISKNQLAALLLI